MLDFIMNLIGLFLRWILYTAIALALLVFFMRWIVWHFRWQSYFDKYLEMIVEWIRDAFRD
jgi:hypothetical protein